MNTTTFDTGSEGVLRSTTKGPVTTARHRRNFVFYAGICILAYLPVLLGLSAAWQAAGLGLLLPGAGFIATGGGWVLLLPVTLAVFWLSVVAWFWAGMVIAPLTVWLGAAVLAAALTGATIWPPALYLAPASMLVVFLYFQIKGARRRKKDLELFKFRQGHFAASVEQVQSIAASEPAPGTRELSAEDLASVRYVLDRALQPVGEFTGFTIIDQFQPAALRYQLNHMGFALGLMQAHYTPNFHGYLLRAQRNLIEKYLLPRVWNYWVLESMWGHFNFTRHDPVVRDNIMLSGWFSMHVGQYMLNTGDRRYAEPGSLTFRLTDRKVYRHDLHSMVEAVADNFASSPFTLFPLRAELGLPDLQHVRHVGPGRARCCLRYELRAGCPAGLARQAADGVHRPQGLDHRAALEMDRTRDAVLRRRGRLRVLCQRFLSPPGTTPVGRGPQGARAFAWRRTRKARPG